MTIFLDGYIAELLDTRAVISGRRLYERAGRWQGDHHNGVPRNPA
jgi:hypothetical protein